MGILGERKRLKFELVFHPKVVNQQGIPFCFSFPGELFLFLFFVICGMVEFAPIFFILALGFLVSQFALFGWFGCYGPRGTISFGPHAGGCLVGSRHGRGSRRRRFVCFSLGWELPCHRLGNSSDLVVGRGD